MYFFFHFYVFYWYTVVNILLFETVNTHIYCILQSIKNKPVEHHIYTQTIMYAIYHSLIRKTLKLSKPLSKFYYIRALKNNAFVLSLPNSNNVWQFSKLFFYKYFFANNKFAFHFTSFIAVEI